MDAEIRCILSRCNGYTADYVEDQPVLFRTKLIQKFIKQDQEAKDGSNAVRRK